MFGGGAAFGMGGVTDMLTEVTMLQVSHGQAASLATKSLYDQLYKKLLKNSTKIGLLILDEPDGGLSVRSASILGKSIAKLNSIGIFVISSIHNPYCMNTATKLVFDTELRKFTTPTDYVNRMLDN